MLEEKYLHLVPNWADLKNYLIIETWLTPRWKPESFLFTVGYIWQTIITTPSLCFLKFHWKINQKYIHVTSHWVTWLNFRKSKAKWFPFLYLTCVKIWSYLQINKANYDYFGFLTIWLGVPNFHKWSKTKKY